MIRCLIGCFLTAIILLIPDAPAYSQDGQEFQLEEIVVTARKREENLQEVPVAISVFTGDVLLQRGILSTRDLYANTPGLNYDTGFDQNAGTPASIRTPARRRFAASSPRKSPRTGKR